MKIYTPNSWNRKMNIIIILKKELRITSSKGNICLKENIKIIDLLTGKHNNSYSLPYFKEIQLLKEQEVFTFNKQEYFISRTYGILKVFNKKTPRELRSKLM